MRPWQKAEPVEGQWEQCTSNTERAWQAAAAAASLCTSCQRASPPWLTIVLSTERFASTYLYFHPRAERCVACIQLWMTTVRKWLIRNSKNVWVLFLGTFFPRLSSNVCRIFMRHFHTNLFLFLLLSANATHKMWFHLQKVHHHLFSRAQRQNVVHNISTATRVCQS